MRKLNPVTLSVALLWLAVSLVLAFYAVYGANGSAMKPMFGLASLGCLGIVAVFLRINRSGSGI